MTELHANHARTIIERVGSSGQPPEYGYQYFTAGLDPYISVLDSEYLASFVKQGGSAFKMIVGVYGGGKTHFLYTLRGLAWEHQYLASYVSLSQAESPFHKLELVYKAIVRGLVPPLTADELLSGYEKGIESFIKIWYAQKMQELRDSGLTADAIPDELKNYISSIEITESTSFENAIKAAFRALMGHQDQTFSEICQWLSGEGYVQSIHRPHGILQRIDRSTAFQMIRSLAQWIRQIGYSGLVVLLDEAERVPSMSSKQRETHLNNLRELIDECGRTSFQGIAIFYAVPDETFLEGRAQTYEALRQRLDTVFRRFNPTGVKIELDEVVSDRTSFLKEVGAKLSQVYTVAHNCSFDENDLAETLEIVAEYADERRYGDEGYKRVFVQSLIPALHFLRMEGRPLTSIDEIQ